MKTDINSIIVGERFRKDLGDLKDLKESIEKHGLLQPIVITEGGVLVAGYRRLEAVKQLGWEEIDASIIPDEAIRDKERDENTVRKGFTVTEMVAVKRYYEPQIAQQAKERQLGALKQYDSVKENFLNGGQTRDIIGDIAGVSGKTLEKAEKIVEAAETDPENFGKYLESVNSGEASIHSAYQKLTKREKYLNDTDFISDQVIDLDTENFKVLLGDFRERGQEIPDNSINLILTDPPYGQDYLDLWEPLGELANRVLVPGGFLVTYTGNMYIPEYINGLSKNLKYFWTCALKLHNRNLVTTKNIFNIWKPLLIFYKEPLHLPQNYLVDFIEGTGREKDLHPWQQSENELDVFIEQLSPVGGSVLDPMAGSGTTLAASLRLNRKAVGIEMNPKYVTEMEKRLGQKQ